MFLLFALGASAIALVRLHATGGYGVTRHGALPGIVLTIVAAGAISSLGARIRIPGQWLRLGQGRVGIAAHVCSVLIAGVVLVINDRGMGFNNPSPFAVYQTAAGWLTRNVTGAEQVLDMTDWSLYFSERTGYPFADVYKAPGDPATRWIVVRGPHVEGRWPYTRVIRELIGGRAPVVLIPARAAPGQLQVRIYDRGPESAPCVDRTAFAPSDRAPTQSRRQPQATSLHTGTPIAPARSRDRGSGS